MQSRKERISLLVRMNRGRIEIPSFLTALSETLGEQLDASVLVPLPQTDSLRDIFRSGYKNATKETIPNYRKFFTENQRALVFRITDRLAKRLLHEDAFLLTKLSDVCGAVQLPISLLLRHTALILKLDGDSLSALSKCETQGLSIDWNLGDQEQLYEVTIWGDRWSAIALSLDGN